MCIDNTVNKTMNLLYSIKLVQIGVICTKSKGVLVDTCTSVLDSCVNSQMSFRI